MAMFAKYDGIDGESSAATHGGWIDVAALQWGAHREGAVRPGSSRVRTPAHIDDILLTIDYEKASPKLLEKCLGGHVVPRLEVEVTVPFDAGEQIYLRYDMENVLITSYQVSASGEAWVRPTVVVGNAFEKIKVTYSHIDAHGNDLGATETEYAVPQAPPTKSKKKSKKGKKKK